MGLCCTAQGNVSSLWSKNLMESGKKKWVHMVAGSFSYTTKMEGTSEINYNLKKTKKRSQGFQKKKNSNKI